VAWFLEQRKEKELPKPLERQIKLSSWRTTGIYSYSNRPPTCRLLTVGQTVDEAAYRHVIMERTCQAQLLAEQAAANGLRKKFVCDEDAQYTCDALSEPVWSRIFMLTTQESLYFDFQTEYNLLLEETKAAFLR